MNKHLECNVLDKSDDTVRINKLFDPIKKLLQQRNVTLIKPFSTLLKEHSKIKKAPKGSQCQKLINKGDTFELVQFLISKSNCNLEIKTRDFNRAKYEYKNIFFTYFALEYPELMQAVAHDQFKCFQFSSHLFDLDVLVAKWIQYVQEIQQNLNQNVSVQLNSINMNEQIINIPMNSDFVSLGNDDDFSFIDDCTSMNIQDDQIDMYDDFLASYN